MKKIFFPVIVAATLALGLFLSCTEARRPNVLKIYNWSAYIGEGVLEDFRQWYKENTGEDIDIVYQTFDINETMLSKIEKGHEDFDIVCPSDYIIERMLDFNLLQPLDVSSIPDSLNFIEKSRSEYIQGMFNKISNKVDANDYAVAYMWGTTGILYNARYVSDEEASSWAVLTERKFKERIFIKDAPRDVFMPLLIYLRQPQLSSGKVCLEDLMHDCSDSSMTDVENFMKQISPLVAGWEADFGKEQMTKELGWLSLNWSGDAQWSIEEAAEVGVELRYTVPREGSCVWFDGWVIPKYARNPKAATWFINFMCRPDIAIRNMDETGYVSANGDISVLESQVDDSLEPIDVSYFFGPEASAVSVSPILYPDRKTIEKCALEHDWGADTDKLITMWSRVKGENAGLLTVIVDSLGLGLVLFTLIYSKLRKRFRKSRRRLRSRN